VQRKSAERAVERYTDSRHRSAIVAAGIHAQYVSSRSSS
jgi:hypothetical protein